ncbi:hypothetical protein [Natronosalvus rutilus]|uniref:Uncharacterized protein n=1 Tax=Natronosalvus rutilus TaxID=2953753 RepID=A0A9E7N9V8_9EURY|nr:hypothetical protein [Natronosalvus rutilus]UTF54392.1 hypothetical protein NGM29_03690 [Natronosalvus rutilus]
MSYSRRWLLRGVGASACGAVVAGCLSGDPSTGNGNGTGNTNNTDGTNDTDENGDDPGDTDDHSIDGRLHNESDSERTFEVTILEGEEVVADDEATVEAGETKTLPAFGRPGQPRTFDVTVEETTATETLAFDVEATPEKKDGHVDITYTAEGALEIAFTPRKDESESGVVVDEPPYEVSEPACSDGERDPLWLCANMDGEPSLTFSQVETPSSILLEEGLAYESRNAEMEFYGTVLTSEDDLERVDRDPNDDVADLIEETDLENEAILVVQTGWGSGTVTPHLKRIEERDNGTDIHAFGCYRRPCEGTDDITFRTVLARFERPSALKSATVSLTVDADTRATFDASGEVVGAAQNR